MAPKRTKKVATTAQLQMQVDEIARRPDVMVPVERVTSDGEIVEVAAPVRHHMVTVEDAEPEPFGRWLLAQRDRGDWIDALANAARADRAFPRNGDPDEVRRYIGLKGGDGEVFEQIDDAERCWSSL